LTRVYFTDRDLGKQFPAILAAAGLHVERHHDLFPPDGSDEQWLKYCGEKGRVAITHDRRIRYKVNELESVMRNNVALLVVIGHAPYADLAKSFIATLPKIEVFLGKQKAPFIAKVYRPRPAELERNPLALGEVLHWYSE
jgi:PIN domain-containing protein